MSVAYTFSLFLSFLFVLITLIVGLRIFLQYFKYREINLLYIGLAWLGMATPYFPEFTQFLFLLIGQPPTSAVIYFFYFLFNIADLPIFLMLWLAGITNMLKIERKKRRLILIIILTLSFLAEILLFYFYFMQPGMIWGKQNETYTWALFPHLLLYSILAIILLTGLMFVREALNAKGETKLKGKLLLIAFLLFVVGAVMDTIFTIDVPIPLMIARLLLASGSIFFYLGFLLPSWVKKRFLK
ncbi:MAG: hypothetical protein R6U96_09015 [Promethearchaeia archaeon]